MRNLSVLVTLVALGGTARATVVWRGDFETGDISQWSKAQQVGPDRIQVSDAVVRQGKQAARFTVQQGDNPINASGNRAELVWTEPEHEGNERFYAWSTLWPLDYPSAPTWQLFTQWHHEGNSGSPPLELFVNGETINLRVEGERVVWQAPLERGKWHDFVLHVYWSSNPQTGFVELYYDGERVLEKTPAATMYPGQVNYLKQGLYRNASIQPLGVLYHDGMTVATTLEDVMPAGAPPAAGAPVAGTPGTPPPATTPGLPRTPSAGASAGGGEAPEGSGGCQAGGPTSAGFPMLGLVVLAWLIVRRVARGAGAG